MAASPNAHSTLAECQQELSESDHDEPFGRLNLKVPLRS